MRCECLRRDVGGGGGFGRLPCFGQYNSINEKSPHKGNATSTVGPPSLPLDQMYLVCTQLRGRWGRVNLGTPFKVTPLSFDKETNLLHPFGFWVGFLALIQACRSSSWSDSKVALYHETQQSDACACANVLTNEAYFRNQVVFFEILRGKLACGRPKLIYLRILDVWPLCCLTINNFFYLLLTHTERYSRKLTYFIFFMFQQLNWSSTQSGPGC